MAASPEQGEMTPSREGSPSSPEASLTWCLAHLSKSRSGSEQAESPGGGRDTDKRSRASQWRALVAIRTQHIKGDKAGIARFRSQGGLGPLLDLLKHPECSRKTLDLSLSILANCCTELQTRVEVRKLDGINIVVDILKRNVALETVQNRAARALGNLAMDPESSALIHSAGGVPLLLLCVSLSSAPSSPTAAPPKDSCPKLECAQSATRALLYLSDSPSNRLLLLTQGTLSALAPLLAPEYPQGLRRAVLRTLHELTRGCGVECAREVSRSGVLAQLGVMASEESEQAYEELALKTLANLCAQGCLRPLVGSLGVIQKFTDEVKKDPLKSGVFLKALCLCCKEAVNRAKVKESGGLEVLVGFLSAQRGHPLARLPIMACVDFVFDESAMEQLQELGLAPLLVARLVELSRGEEESAEKMDVSRSASMAPSELLPSSCFDSFDFPPPEGCKKEEPGKEQGSSSFLSLRSWLVSEGLISSEGDLLDASAVEGDWTSLQIPPTTSSSSSSPQTSSPNPYTCSSLKNPSSATPPASAAPKKPAQSSPLSSSSSSSSCKVTDSPSATPPSSGSSVSSSTSSTKTPPTPVSPSKFSSPHRKRHRAHSAAGLTKVSLDPPPSVPPRPATYNHPYHPEPWTPESPILLLLSRFSHATDPSAALVSSGAVWGLLLYLAQHPDPSSRCFRMLCRLSCNPNCLQALVRTGSVALIRHLLCQRGGGAQEGEEEEEEEEERQTQRVKAKVKQLGVALLNNLRVQCESGFGSGVLAHVMLSGSETDKMNCALCLPLVTSNKSLLKKLLLDSGGLLSALRPLGHSDADDDDDDAADEDHSAEGGRLLFDLFNSPLSGGTSHTHSLYFPLLAGCLSTLTAAVKSELGKKRPITARPAGQAASVSPPPCKRPRLAEPCPYAVSSYDLVFLLDDGTRIPANREEVGGAGSRYFRALLRGGFGEAQGAAEEAIAIKDVTAGMLVPVLHYLHGCRLTEDPEGGEGSGGRCPVLDRLVLTGLRFCGKDPSGEDSSFQESPLGETMIGACRFLVEELQAQVEELCVSLLLACSSQPAAPPLDGAEKAAWKMDQDGPESAEENLATRTSELELTGSERPTGTLRGPAKKANAPLQEPDGPNTPPLGPAPKISRGVDREPIRSVAPGSASVDEPLGCDEPTSIPKNVSGGAAPPVRRAACGGGGALTALLPQVYWFSQRHSYPGLRRACLWLLLGGQDCARLPSPAGHCLRRLAKQADCTDTLKQDLLSVASAALS